MPLSHAQFAALLSGFAWTAALSLIAFVCGGAAGFAVALGRIAPSRLVRGVLGAYVQAVQGTPVLILMFILYFGLSFAGLDVPPLLAASIGMTVYVSAFLGEIWRGCLLAVPRTQWEAAECLALSRVQRLQYVVLPQAVRMASPLTAGFAVQIVKSTSLASIIGLSDLAYVGKMLGNATFRPFQVYLITSVLYFLLCYPLSWLSRWLERRVRASHR